MDFDGGLMGRKDTGQKGWGCVPALAAFRKVQRLNSPDFRTRSPLTEKPTGFKGALVDRKVVEAMGKKLQ